MSMSRPDPPPFSVVVLARNEAHTLPRLVQSLAAFVSEGGDVLVVDTGSTDATMATAGGLGCRIETVGTRFESLLSEEQARDIEARFARDGEGPLVSPGSRMFDFAEARQHAGMLARHEYVFQLDASDEIVHLDLQSVSPHLSAGRAGVLEYELRLENISLRVARLYDRRLYRWRGRSHEGLYGNPETRPPGVSARIGCSERELLVRHHKDEKKPRNYLPGLALDAIAYPDEGRWKHYLGRELYYQRHYASATAVLEEHAAIADASVSERGQSLCFAGECYERTGRVGDAAESYRRAAAIDATRREPRLRLAALSCRLGNFEEAAATAGEALTIPRTAGYAEDLSCYTWQPHALLYWSLFWLGRRHEARAHWEECLRLAPDDARIQGHGRLFPEAVQPGGCGIVNPLQR